jgi:MGT family glycosyltransferase
VSRFLFTSWPLYGHMLPKLAMASALRERNHEVAFYTGSQARPRAEAEDIEVFPFERVDEQAIADAIRELEERAGVGRPSLADVRRCFDRCLIEPMPGQVADVSAISRAWKPDAIVCDLPIWGPMVILAETTPVPVALASGFLGPPASGSDVPPPGLGLPSPRGPGRRALAWSMARATDVAARRLRERIDALRAEHGLEPMGRSVNDHLGRLPLTLIPSIRHLDYGRRHIPPGVHYVGPCQWQPPEPPGARAWEEAVPQGRPWVHVAASTMAGSDAGLLHAALRGLADRPVEVIATGGKLPADLRPDLLPANAHLAPWVNHARLLPRCDAVVTPGGAGTIVGALAAGVPLVVVPTVWDKPDNAQRVVEAGVGVRLSPRRCTPERLRAAVEEVLANRAYRERARRMAALLAAAPGPAGAAALLEGLAAGRAPAGSVEIGGRA